MNQADKSSAAPREVELKFQLPPGGRAALEASPTLAAVEAKHCHEVTTYYDTPDCVLDNAGLTMRVRQSGDTRIQTVKSRATGPGIATSRNEWEWQIGDDEPDVDPLVKTKELTKVAKSIKGRLEPVFVTDIHRTTRLLHLTGITVVEVAIDEGSIEVGSASEPVSEVELELKGGRIGPMFRLAAELQTLAPLWISPESKSVRGWHLRTGQTEGAQKALVPHLGRHALAAAGFQEIIDLKLGHVMANLGPTLRGDPEGVHQIRIAIRGSRAALKLFERHLDVAAAGRFDAGLRRFGLIFGTARDWDVFYLETLPAAMADLSAERLWDLSPPAEIERQAAHAAVEKALRGPEFTGLLLGIAVWAGAGVIQPGTLGDRRMGKRLGRLAPSLLERVAGKAKKRGQHAGRLSAEGLHRLRKACKKLLYDVESLSGLYSDRAVKIYLGQCEDLGAVLGGATDAVVTQRLALKLVTESRPDLARPANALARWSARRRRGMLHGLKGEMKEFRDAPDFWS